MGDMSCGDDQVAGIPCVRHHLAMGIHIVVFSVVCLDTYDRQALGEVDLDMTALCLETLCGLDKRIFKDDRMKISFSCTTNKPYAMVDKAIFILPK